MARTRKSGLASRRTQAGKASNYIRFFEERPGDRFILCCRVSAREQKRKGDLEDQEANLREVVAAMQGIVIDVFHHVGSGWNPAWLTCAAIKAKECDAILLAETTDRFVRSPLYLSTSQEEQARISDLEGLRIATMGVPLMTHLAPDATPRECRSYQSKRGKRLKQKPGGRPKTRRGTYMPNLNQSNTISEVYAYRNAGFSIREIANLVGRSPSTIQGWIKDFGKVS